MSFPGTLVRRLTRRARRAPPTPAAPATSRHRRPPPEATVAVVVPVGAGDTGAARSTVASLLRQQHPVQVLVVPWGGAHPGRTDLPGGKAAVRVLAPVDGGFADACDLGARSAETDYVVFVEPGSVLAPSAVRSLSRSLAASGSDFAVGGYASGRLTVRPAGPRKSVGIADAPEVAADDRLGSRMFRTDRWGTIRDRAPDAPDTPGHLALSASLTSRFDVVDAVVLREPAGEEPVAPIAGLEAWLSRSASALDLVTRSADDRVREVWAAAELEDRAAPFVGDVERATEEQWRSLRGHVQALVECAGEGGWRRLRAEARVRTWLLTVGRRTELERLVADRWFERDNVATLVRDGRVYALLPYFGDDAVGVPESCFEMEPHESSLAVSLRGLRWISRSRLEIELYAYIRYVDLAGGTPEVSVSLVDAAGRREVEPAVEAARDPRANLVAAARFQDQSTGALRVVVDAAELVRSAGRGRTRWHLHVRLAVSGVQREGTVTDVEPLGSAAGLGTPALAPRRVGRHQVALSEDPRTGLRITTERAPVVELVAADTGGRRVTAQIASSRSVVHVVARRAGTPDVVVPVVPEGSRSRFGIDVPEPSGPGREGRWTLHAVDDKGTEHPVGWPSEVTDEWCGDSAVTEVVLRRTRRGTCSIVESGEVAVLDGVELEAGAVRVRGHWLGRPVAGARLELRGAGAVLGPVPLEPATGTGTGVGRFEALVSTTWDEWELGAAPAPVGRYRLVLLDDEVSSAGPTLRLGEPLRARLMEEQVGRDHRVRLLVADDELRIALQPPLADDEKGPFQQTRLGRTYAGDPDRAVSDTTVYLQSYAGTWATDSPLAIAEDLLRRRPDLDLYWGVSDRSAWVPDGVTPLLMGSRDWHRVHTTAKYLVSNIAFDRRFVKRLGQLALHTMHGYPAKTLAMQLWRRKQHTPLRIEAELARTSRTWDALLSPCPEIDEVLRAEYDYSGEILSVGYPRDDVLVSPAAPRVREATRARLGIEDGQTAVLFAPTFRDDLSTGRLTAAFPEREDFVAAAAGLSDDHVVLLRGHRYHAARTAAPGGAGARIVDVTSYPEVNDLILAADVAVLDYSSLRFDFALTGRPMLFLVPDLDRYSGEVRGFLLDFRDTAPGPLLGSAAEVVDRLGDLGAVQAEHAESYERFNRKYNYLQDGHSTERVVDAFFGAR
jgi:CDP-glycerol glycerophosphotransferase